MISIVADNILPGLFSESARLTLICQKLVERSRISSASPPNSFGVICIRMIVERFKYNYNEKGNVVAFTKRVGY